MAIADIHTLGSKVSIPMPFCQVKSLGTERFFVLIIVLGGGAWIWNGIEF